MISDPRIDRALEQALEAGELGVQVAAYLGEELIVNTWAGVADATTGRAVEATTLFAVFSVTKAVTATALHIQAERGLLEYDAHVADYWPEYAANGKATTTVRDALMHRAGIPQMPEGVTPERMCDWEWMVRQIENFEPWFEPGTTNAYHVLVWGWLIGELVRRTDPAQRPLEAFVQSEICEPLGIEDLYVGLPASEHQRVAPVYADWEPQADPEPLKERAMPLAVSPAPPVHNRPDVWQACIPGAGGIMTAHSCARLFALLANGGELDGVRLFSEARVRSFTQPRDDVEAIDRVNGVPCYVGAGGYWVGGTLPPEIPADGSRPSIIHHAGAGQSVGWADLDTKLAVALCHNKMQPLTADPVSGPLLPIAEAIRAVVHDLVAR
jgi:CubicO group peptidase (beta-lactamase class C family)